MATNIATAKGRQALKPRRPPYWHKIKTGCFLGFRKMTRDSKGVWWARYRNDDGKQVMSNLGSFDDDPPNERFDKASEAANAWFEHLGRGGNSDSVTVREACENYVQHLRATKSERAAHDTESRFKRWVYSNGKFSETPLEKLKPTDVSRWRAALKNTNAIPQDKAQEATRLRADSTLNRDMTSLRAAFNLAFENSDVTSDHAWRSKLKPIENADGRRDVYLDVTQRRALISNAPDDLAALLRGLSLVPLRPGAIAALTAGNFDRRISTLTIGKDKNGGDRKITLPTMTAAFFGKCCKDKLPNAPLLARANGAAWNKDAWKGPFKEAALAAGLPAATTCYALRHSTITDLIALHKLDTLTVAQLSGTSLQMIERHYGHLLREHAAQALAKLKV